uniref:Uncharacterized protein n=1 Tax=Panagrolaimus sp. PS1159 TaxID=55785 RepID=A0AC35F5J6_9BILA
FFRQISELKLAAGGCEFDESGCMLSVSDEARQFLKRRTTDATTVYHAFGAEYYQYITGDLGIMDEASIPLLYSIALQTRFPEATRRKACAALRRKLVKVLGWFKAADRAKMPFPVNIVENAYCKNPRYFYEPSGIKTDSRSDQQKKQIGGEKRKRSQP